MSTAVNGNELHFHFGVVAPACLLDVHSVGHLAVTCLSRASDVVEVGKILARLPRRPNLAAPDEQAEQFDLSTIERVQGIHRAVHDHDGRSAWARAPAFEVLRRRHVCSYRRNCAKAGRSFERKTKRHMTATGNAGRKHVVPIDTDFSDERVDDPVKNPTSSMLSLFAL
jgi:hypothetical protein